MSTTPRRPIIVAVGDDDEHDAAVSFAATEAVRDDRPLQVVHVVDPPAGGPGPEQLLLTFASVDVVGEELLRSAVDHAEEIVAGRVPVTKRLEHGSVVQLLVELSRSADRVVLQHRHLTRLQRVFTGSVCSGVAGRARVPVVSVPELWADPGTVSHLVVGIDDTTGNDALLEQAFAAAADRQADLTVLHAWFIPSMYDEALLGREAIVAAREAVRAQIQEQMDACAAVHPTVEAHLEVSHVRPADALVAASRRSDLLLVGRRSASHSPAHLGPVTRALVRESRCPVMVLAAPGVRGRTADVRRSAPQMVVQP